MASLKSDICIIGATLEGLTTAQALSARGFDVTIIEKSDRVGGALHPTTTEFGSLSKQFSYWPDNASTEMALKFLEHVLNRDLQFEKNSLPPQTFHKGQLQTFVGFGESAPDYADEFSYYLSDARIVNSESASSLLSELQTKFLGKIIFGTSLRRVELEGNTVRAIELDDGRHIEASAFIFAENPLELFSLLPTEEYTQREIQRVHRTAIWNTVALDIVHSTPVTEQKNLFVLLGNVKDSLPCLGGFDSPVEVKGRKIQSSHWLTFISTDLEDEELSANALREIKRQIKRAFPHALENVAFEKITLHPHSHGKLHLKSDAQSRWPGLTNFWLSNAHLNSQPNDVGSLCQSALVVEAVSTHLSPEILANPVAHSHL